MNILLDLYITFFKIGATAFGGGYAVLPLIDSFVVREKGWLTIVEMTDVVSISNMTPGPIAINAATFVGTKIAGLPGSIVSTLGVVSPSFILMMILGYMLFSTKKKLAFIDKILLMLKPAIVGLIGIAAINMTRNSVFTDGIINFANFNLVAFICFVIGLVLYLRQFDLMKLIGLGATLGIFLSLVLGV